MRYTLWKQQNGRTLAREEALEHIRAGRSSKDLEEEREVIGPCLTPGCGGQIVERSRSFWLHELEEPLRAGLRLRHLEAGTRAQG